MPVSISIFPHRLSLILFISIMLIGCKQNDNEDAFDTYHQRLANVLDIDKTPFPETPLQLLPAKRVLIQPLADIRIGLLDAYELRQCGLFQLIAERNSILGKVQDKTRGLRYELLLLDGLQYCLETLPKDSDLLTELAPIYQQKKQQLPLVFWNTLFTGEEWRKQLTLGHHLLESNQTTQFNASLSAFSYINNLLSNSIKRSNNITAPYSNKDKYQNLFEHQQQIYNSRYIGDLFYSMQRTTTLLNTITEQLTQSQDAILCGKNMNQQKAQYLRNVFYKFYVPTIQPYLSTLDSQYRQIQPVLQQILQQLNQPNIHLSSPMQTYIAFYVDGDLYQQFHEATLAHVKFWQRLFKQCKFKVGQ
ncbi:DUF3080 domain-containing protein [Photobacterium sp. GB-210]|uniref:DUF3080 domain-containing protein n=1 Tax=Photobacterium sp. GB-210 TaxID=2022104 RepID=UPI001E3EC4D7|nr:DUF3080 domain-containing protein [Photobacterium sp. GB-210]